MIKAFNKVAAMAHFSCLEPTKTNKLQAFHVIKRCTLSSIYPLPHPNKCCSECNAQPYKGRPGIANINLNTDLASSMQNASKLP